MGVIVDFWALEGLKMELIDVVKHMITVIAMLIAFSIPVSYFRITIVELNPWRNFESEIFMLFKNILFYQYFTFLEYLVPYLWKCYRGKPLCAIGEFCKKKIFGEVFSSWGIEFGLIRLICKNFAQFILDNGEWGGPNSCATKLCECDRALSKCLR